MRVSLPIINKARMQGHQYADKIEFLPTYWVHALACQSPTPTDMNALWLDLCRNGLCDPLVLGVGKDNTLRLDAGNHRIKLFVKYGINTIPVIAKVWSNAIIDPRNGLHCFPFRTDTSGIPNGTLTKPSHVIPELKQILA